MTLGALVLVLEVRPMAPSKVAATTLVVALVGAALPAQAPDRSAKPVCYRPSARLLGGVEIGGPAGLVLSFAGGLAGLLLAIALANSD